MKRISTVALIIILALLMACLLPARVFADSLPEYISEVKVYLDDYKDAAREGFTGGTLALTGGAGIALGALATAIGMTATKKKKEQTA